MLLIFHPEFDHVFVAYLSTHLLTYFLLTYQLICFFCTFSPISSRRKSTIVTPNISHCKVKSIVLIISSHENFKLKHLMIKFYRFFKAFWPPVLKAILVLQWRWRKLFSKIWTDIPCLILYFKQGKPLALTLCD